MKLLVIATAFAASLAAMPAQAQDRVVRSTTVTRHVSTSAHHEDAVPRHGWRWKRVCRTRWVNHRKIRSCKKVRVRW
jgi:hypothetical protein